jgi:hypothetical protein
VLATIIAVNGITEYLTKDVDTSLQNITTTDQVDLHPWIYASARDALKAYKNARPVTFTESKTHFSLEATIDDKYALLVEPGKQAAIQVLKDEPFEYIKGRTIPLSNLLVDNHNVYFVQESGLSLHEGHLDNDTLFSMEESGEELLVNDFQGPGFGILVTYPNLKIPEEYQALADLILEDIEN